jgi:hypothetical protein
MTTNDRVSLMLMPLILSTKTNDPFSLEISSIWSKDATSFVLDNSSSLADVSGLSCLAPPASNVSGSYPHSIRSILSRME